MATSHFWLYSTWLVVVGFLTYVAVGKIQGAEALARRKLIQEAWRKFYYSRIAVVLLSLAWVSFIFMLPNQDGRRGMAVGVVAAEWLIVILLLRRTRRAILG
jgi:hypothetical protein